MKNGTRTIRNSAVALLAMSAMLLLGLAWAVQEEPPADPARPTVRLVEFETQVTSATADRIVRAIDEAEEAGDDLIFIRLDTPGGLVSATETIIKRMLSSQVPIVVWVGPSGAMAASAGFFILTAADIAAMAPATRTGASSTVMMGKENRDDDPILRKSNEINAALMRSIAEKRNRNKEAAEQAIFEAKAFEETVALRDGLIDLVAQDRDDVLAQIDGRKITMFDGRETTLRTADAQFVTTDLGPYQAFMETLAMPAVAGLLLMGGLLGLYIEITQPGGIVPGVVGGIALILFAVSAQILPISALGVLLIVAATVMFVLEVKITSYGLLTVGGAICLVLGGWMLVDGPIPEMRIPLELLIPMSLLVVAVVLTGLVFAMRAQKNRVETGVEGLVGATGRVTRSLNPEGKILIHGEVWNAVTDHPPLDVDRKVRVTRVDDLMLTVMPEQAPESTPQGESS